MPDTMDAVTEALDGRYDVVREIGRGGMATVYLAEDLRHHRRVAVKVLRKELAASLAINRFLKEIHIAAGLNHPHIVPLLDSGDVNGVLHFVMPFVEGRSVRGLLHSEGTVGLETALRIAAETADALTYAHRRGLIHRDVKPENILLSEGHAVVADFGIAKAISTAGGEQLTRTGFPIGTLGYMSPEQAAGRTDLDETTDIYSLASVVYEMLIGEPPGMWVSDEAMKYGRFVDASSAHREKLDILPGAVEPVLVQAMCMRCSDRHPTPNAFARALESATQSPARFDTQQVRHIIRRASESQVNHPTQEGALSLGAVERIGAEVGLSPQRVRAAVAALPDRPDPSPLPGGILGAPAHLELERTIEGELPPEAFDALLEEVRAATGEVGRINETLGPSLSWNSLSFQNSMEGAGRLIHVMVKPNDGATRIRITESAGAAPLLPVLGTVVGGAGLATSVVGLIASPGSFLGIVAFGAAFGTVYLAARAGFRLYMQRRARKLGALLDRLAQHAIDHAPPPRLPAGRVKTPD